MTIKDITKEEVNLLLTSNLSYKYKLAIYIGCIDGLRISEICSLKLEDLDFVNNLYTLKNQKNKLKFKNRYMSNKVKKQIILYIFMNFINIINHKNYLIYSNGLKHKLNSSKFGWTLQRWRKKLNIDRIYKISKNGKKLARNTIHATRVKSTTDFIKKSYEKNGFVDPISIQIHGGWLALS
ncbi:MAG: site-specific integrase, partial [Candidatus Thorarchaeota archaeon]